MLTDLQLNFLSIAMPASLTNLATCRSSICVWYSIHIIWILGPNTFLRSILIQEKDVLSLLWTSFTLRIKNIIGAHDFKDDFRITPMNTNLSFIVYESIIYEKKIIKKLKILSLRASKGWYQLKTFCIIVKGLKLINIVLKLIKLQI